MLPTNSKLADGAYIFMIGTDEIVFIMDTNWGEFFGNANEGDYINYFADHFFNVVSIQEIIDNTDEIYNIPGDIAGVNYTTIRLIEY